MSPQEDNTFSIMATLVDHFHLTIPEIAQLTERQMNEIYFHKRDSKTGFLVMPATRVAKPEDETYAGEMARYKVFEKVCDPVKFAEGVRKIKDKYGVR